MRIDLNADLGESFGIFTVGDDEGVLACVSSANVAAGFHGGDPSAIRRAVRSAAARGVAVGAHPSFPDLLGFGRREMQLSDREVEDAVLYQIASVAGIARAEGVALRHVKPHGAMYTMAARDRTLAHAIVRAIVAFDRSLTLFAPPGSALAEVGVLGGLSVAREGFADRRYLSTGELAPREMTGAVIEDPDDAARQAVRLALSRGVETADGPVLGIEVDTICVHGDRPGAAARAACTRAALEAAGVVVTAPASAP